MSLNDDNLKNNFKSEFMMVQSCERRKNEMVYKNVSRKFISFDLSDKQQMADVGKTLKPFGFIENLQKRGISSRFEFFRIWAETRLAKRGEIFLRNLYQEHPEKFFEVSFERSSDNVLALRKCKYIVNETTSQKTVSLTEENNNSEMDQIRETLLLKERSMEQEHKLAEDFTPSLEDIKLIASN